MIVKANLGGQNSEFIVDTGASFCVASKKFIKNIKVKDLGFNAVAKIANGSKVSTPLILANLTLNNFDLGEVLVAVLPNDDVSFLLGNSVMQELDYYVDHDKKVIT